MVIFYLSIFSLPLILLTYVNRKCVFVFCGGLIFSLQQLCDPHRGLWLLRMCFVHLFFILWSFCICRFSRFPAFSRRTWTGSANIFLFSGDLIVSSQQTCDLHWGWWLPRIVLCVSCSSYYDDFVSSTKRALCFLREHIPIRACFSIRSKWGMPEILVLPAFFRESVSCFFSIVH
jgi:hypothetical protein